MLYEFISDIRHNDFRTQVMSVEDLLEKYEMLQSFRPKSLIGFSTHEQRSRIIETILMGIPQPPLYVDDSDMQWIVIDGVERVDAIYSFCKSKMPLKSLYFKMDKYEGRFFDSLSPVEKNKILNTQIQVHVLNSGLSRQERFGIYTCLKSRYGADVARWCRKRLYTKEYALIEKLAQSIRKITGSFLSTPRLERMIGNILAGVNYKDFMNSSERHNIDVAVNAIMEAPSFEIFIKTNESYVIEAFDLPSHARYDLHSDRYGISDLYFAVRFHKLKSGLRFNLSYGQFYEQCKDNNIIHNLDNSLEAFCSNINLLMHIL